MLNLRPPLKIWEDHCPVCGHILDGIREGSPEDGRKTSCPNSGDLTICVYCASVLVFTELLELRIARDDEIAEMRNQISHMQQLVIDAQKSLKLRN